MRLQKCSNSPERLPLAYTTYCLNVDEDSFHFNYCIKTRVARYLQPCFNWQKPVYYSGNLRAVDAQLLYFTYKHYRQSQKLTSSTVACIEMNVIQWR